MTNDDRGTVLTVLLESWSDVEGRAGRLMMCRWVLLGADSVVGRVQVVGSISTLLLELCHRMEGCRIESQSVPGWNTPGRSCMRRAAAWKDPAAMAARMMY